MRVTVHSQMPMAQALIKQKAGLGLKRAVDDVHRVARPRTPRKYGNLANLVLKQALGLRGTVQWTAGYAQYQERGYTTGPVRHYTTGGTGAHFAENAVRTVAANPSKYFTA